MTTPALPYAGTAGYSGSDSSEQQARREADDGTVAYRQRQALVLLRRAKARGVTVHELARQIIVHHGKASSVLSVLHKEGHLARLVDKRGAGAIYVLPEYINDRDTAAHGRRNAVDEALRHWLTPTGSREVYSLATGDPQGFIEAMRQATGYGV